MGVRTTEVYLRSTSTGEGFGPESLLKLTFRGAPLEGQAEDLAFQLMSELSKLHESMGGGGLTMEAWVDRDDDDEPISLPKVPNEECP